MKKIIKPLLVLGTVFALTACGGAGEAYKGMRVNMDTFCGYVEDIFADYDALYECGDFTFEYTYVYREFKDTVCDENEIRTAGIEYDAENKIMHAYSTGESKNIDYTVDPSKTTTSKFRNDKYYVFDNKVGIYLYEKDWEQSGDDEPVETKTSGFLSANSTLYANAYFNDRTFDYQVFYAMLDNSISGTSGSIVYSEGYYLTTYTDAMEYLYCNDPDEVIQEEYYIDADNSAYQVDLKAKRHYDDGTYDVDADVLLTETCKNSIVSYSLYDYEEIGLFYIGGIENLKVNYEYTSKHSSEIKLGSSIEVPNFAADYPEVVL